MTCNKKEIFWKMFMLLFLYNDRKCSIIRESIKFVFHVTCAPHLQPSVMYSNRFDTNVESNLNTRKHTWHLEVCWRTQIQFQLCDFRRLWMSCTSHILPLVRRYGFGTTYVQVIYDSFHLSAIQVNYCFQSTLKFTQIHGVIKHPTCTIYKKNAQDEIN